jgi:hypothetical protein
MNLFRDFIIFLAGAEFFHTISHIFIARFMTLPIHTSVVELTLSLNNWAIAINGIITVLLIVWAVRLKKNK